MNKFYYLLIALFYFHISFAQTLSVGGFEYNVDTLENHKVGPGTQYVSLRLTTTDKKRLDVFFLVADMTNPHLTIKTGIGNDSIYIGEPVSKHAQRKSSEGNYYFAGTNGDFYSTTGDYLNYPTSGSMIQGQIAKPTVSGRPVFAYDADKVPHIGIMSYSGQIDFGEEQWPINYVNHLRETNYLVLYNEYNGKVTRTNQHGTEVLVELLDGYEWGSNETLKARVLEIEKGVGSMKIPKGKAVLSGHGTGATNLNKLAVDDVVDIKFSLSLKGNDTANYQQITGGDPYAIMLENGKVAQTGYWNEKHPRTGIGHSQDGNTIYFCVVDGRGYSQGVTTKEFGEIMQSAGAYTAVNMDGGGSSSMYINGYGSYVNAASDGYERSVANCIFAVSTAPTDNIVGEIAAYQPRIALPMFGEHIPKFYGYNQYGVQISKDVKDVVLSCPAELGTIDGGKFIAGGNETTGIVTATYNGTVIAEISVTVNPIDGLSILLDSVIIDNREEYAIEVFVTTNGVEAQVDPASVAWTIEDTEICSITNGFAKALKNGSTKVTGSIGSISDEMLIKVQSPAAAVIQGDAMKVADWQMSATAFLKATLNEENLPANWGRGAAVNFTSAAGRSPYITLTNKKEFFGLPDTIRFIMNTGDIEISRAIFSLKANNDTKVTSYELNTFEKNADYHLDIPLKDVFDLNNKAVFPISFDNVRFYIDNGSMTNGQAYCLAIKEISLAYSGYMGTGLTSTKENSFTLYPNPVTGKVLNIALKNNATRAVRTEIFGLSGQLLSSKQHGAHQGNIISLDVSRLSSGLYLLKVYEGEQISVQKFSVE